MIPQGNFENITPRKGDSIPAILVSKFGVKNITNKSMCCPGCGLVLDLDDHASLT